MLWEGKEEASGDYSGSGWQGPLLVDEGCEVLAGEGHYKFELRIEELQATPCNATQHPYHQAILSARLLGFEHQTRRYAAEDKLAKPS